MMPLYVTRRDRRNEEGGTLMVGEPASAWSTSKRMSVALIAPRKTACPANDRFPGSCAPIVLGVTNTMQTMRAMIAEALAIVAILAMLPLGSACNGKGRVRLVLDLPDRGNKELYPMDERLTELRLQVHRGGDTVINTAAWSLNMIKVTIGDIDPGPVDSLILAGYSAEGRLLAYGRTTGLLVPDGQAINIPLVLRKPISYVTGGGTLLPFDTTKLNDAQILSPIDISRANQGPGVAVTSTPDGRYVLVAATNPARLVVVDTKTDSPISQGGGINLSANPKTLAVSPDGQWVVVGMDSGSRHFLTAYAFSDILSGNQPRGIDYELTGSPGPMTFVRRENGILAVEVLVQPWPQDKSCDQVTPADTSSVMAFDLGGSTITQTTQLDGPASDLTTSLDSAYTFVAEPCEARGQAGPGGVIALIDPLAGTKKTNYSADNVRSLAMAGSVVIVGQMNATTASIDSGATLQLFTIEVNNVRQVLAPMPYYEQEITVGDALEDGTRMGLTLVPRLVLPYAISPAPAGGRAGILVHAQYQYTEDSLYVGGQQLPHLTVDTWSYVTVDLAGPNLGNRTLLRCDVSLPNFQGNALNCGEFSRGEAPNWGSTSYPTDITTLYGVR